MAAASARTMVPPTTGLLPGVGAVPDDGVAVGVELSLEA
jgi:hypothetical protein